MLNPTNVPDFEAVAPTGVGVFDTLKAVAKLVLTELKRGGDPTEHARRAEACRNDQHVHATPEATPRGRRAE